MGIKNKPKDDLKRHTWILSKFYGVAPFTQFLQQLVRTNSTRCGLPLRFSRLFRWYRRRLVRQNGLQQGVQSVPNQRGVCGKPFCIFIRCGRLALFLAMRHVQLNELQQQPRLNVAPSFFQVVFNLRRCARQPSVFKTNADRVYLMLERFVGILRLVW